MTMPVSDQRKFSHKGYQAGRQFAPKTIGLGGWTPSNVHHYDASNGILYRGDGGIQNLQAQPLPKSAGVYATDPSGSQVFTFNVQGILLLTPPPRCRGIAFSLAPIPRAIVPFKILRPWSARVRKS